MPFHRRRCPRALARLLLAALLALPSVVELAPTASAAIATTPLEQDVWNQIAAPLTGSNSGAQSTDALTLTASQTYYLYVGTNAVFGQVVRAGTSVGATDLFQLDQNGILTPGTKGPDVALVSMTNTTQTYNPYYAVLRVTPTTTATYYLNTNTGGFGNPGSLSMGWTFPPGDTTSHSGVLGYAGAWHNNGGSTELAFAIKCCPQQLSEAGALSEISKTTSGIWDDSKATWTRVNYARSQYDTLASTGDWGYPARPVTHVFYQSFVPDTTLGSYLESVAFHMSGAQGVLSGTMNTGVFVGPEPTLPIDWTQARVWWQMSYGLTQGCGCSTDADLTANFTSGIASWSGVTGGGSASVGAPTIKEFGQLVTTSRAPTITMPNATDHVYVVVSYTTQSSAYTPAGERVTTGNNVATGQYCKTESTTWTCTSGYDLSTTIRLYGGQSITAYTLAANPQTHGGAVWVYVREKLQAAGPQQYSLSSTFGGKAKAGSFQFANASYVIQEWRLGYVASPWNQSQTLEVDVNTMGSLNNIVEAATFVSQSNTAHWHPLQFTAGVGLNAIELFSTDDYYTSVQFVVKQCLDDACATLGQIVNTTAYVVTICSGAFSRTLSGNVDANASFTITGQDIPNCLLSITLSASGYAMTPWSITVPAAGSFVYTLGIFTTSTRSVQPTLGAVTITFDGNATRTIPDRVQVNVTRSRSVALFVGADHIDPTTGTVQHNVVRATYWDPFTSSTFTFYYPTRAKSGPQDKGGYILWVMNDTGIVLGYEKYFLEPVGTSWTTDDFTITSDMLLAISQAGYTSAQQSYQQSFQASILLQQKTVRDQIYEDFQNLHNYGAVFLALLGLLAVVRAFRR